jgi:hypothetical protein
LHFDRDLPDTENMDDVGLPEVLDPVLDYLDAHLPPQLYDAAETLLTQVYALLSSLFALGRNLIFHTSESLDAQKIIPPLITLLAAYLALVSFYRTTGWMLRTAFAFAKWGFILSTLGGLAGYMLANGNAAGGGAGNGLGMFANGILPGIGGLLLRFLDPDAQNAGRAGERRAGAGPSSRTRAKTAGQRKGKGKQERPKAWDSWDKHREWQYQEHQQQDEGQDGAGVQEVIGNILGELGKAAPGWWEKVMGGPAGTSQDDDGTAQDGQAGRKKGRGSKSR